MSRRRILPLIPGLLLLAVFLAGALFPQAFTRYGRKEMFDAWEAPSGEHWLGTNHLGYDIYTELVWGTGDTLVTGLSASALTLVLGAGMGLLAARRGAAGAIAGGITNMSLLLPRLIALIVLSAFFGTGRLQLIVLISLFGWGATARAVRAQVMHLKAMPFADSLRVQGLGKARIALGHILPNLSDVLLSRLLLGINSCIMTESTLSFLGMGDLYYPTWGTMINLAYQRGALLRQAYAYLLAPGAAIALLTLSFYLISTYFSARAGMTEN